MNKLLTKEQAGWLLEQLKAIGTHKRFRVGVNERDSFFLEADIENIINQCTEKEFPTFAVNMDNCAISIDLWCKYYIKVWLELSEPAFTFENFKVFTDGCQRIVEWIENNEK